jgi:hypothetical protein
MDSFGMRAWLGFAACQELRAIFSRDVASPEIE